MHHVRHHGTRRGLAGWRGARRLVAAAGCACFAGGAHATDCSQQAPAQVCPPAPAKPLFEVLSEQAQRVEPLNLDPPAWFSETGDPPDAIAPPIEVKPASDGLAVRTSTARWREFNAQSLNRRIEQSKALTQEGVQAPRGSPASAPLDVWTSFETDNLAGHADSVTRTGVGADLALDKSAKIGVSAEQAEQLPAVGAARDGGRKVGGYVAVTGKSTSVTLDAKAEVPPAGADPAALAPVPAAGEPPAKLTIAPRAAHKLALEGKTTVEPFLRYEQRMSLGAAPLRQPAASTDLGDAAGIGVTLAEPDAYSVTATTDVENLSAPDGADIKGRLELKLPLP